MLWSHKHYWRPKTSLNAVEDPATGKIVAGLILENCQCGAVRTIEFSPGRMPVIRMADSAVCKETRK